MKWDADKRVRLLSASKEDLSAANSNEKNLPGNESAIAKDVGEDRCILPTDQETATAPS